MNKLKRYIDPISRICLVLIFLLSGFDKLDNFSATAEYMSAEGLPMASILLIIAIVIELGGGFMIACNYRSAQATLALLGFMIIATLSFHDFWNYDEAERQLQYMHFMKNLSIIGALGLLYLHFDKNKRGGLFELFGISVKTSKRSGSSGRSSRSRGGSRRSGGRRGGRR
jgi:putative oxidoreductase